MHKMQDFDNEVGHFANEVGRFANEVGRFDNEVSHFANEVGHFANEVGRFANEVGRFANEVDHFTNEIGASFHWSGACNKHTTCFAFQKCQKVQTESLFRQSRYRRTAYLCWLVK